jgi:hypothetical protein
LITAAFFSGQGVAQSINAPSDLSPDAYIARRGGTLAPAGRLEIDGRRMRCGRSPTVLDPNERDFGSAYSGFLVLNPDLFAGLPTPVKLWIFSHECAHRTVGSDEVKADCVAVQRGRREAWLNEGGLAQVCEFMKPAHADGTHFNGTRRCALMLACFSQDRPNGHSPAISATPASRVR